MDPLVAGIPDGTTFTLTSARALRYGVRLSADVVANGAVIKAGEHFVVGSLPAGTYVGHLTLHGFSDPAVGIGKRIMYAPDGAVATPPASVPPSLPAAPQAAGRVVAFDTSKATRVAQEPDSYTPMADGPVYFGANVTADGGSAEHSWKAGSYFFAIQAKQGVPVKLDYRVLGDPIPGVAKALYVPLVQGSSPVAKAAPMPAVLPTGALMKLSGVGEAFYRALAGVPARTYVQATSFGTAKHFYEQSIAHGYIPRGGGGAVIFTAWGGGALRQRDGKWYFTAGGHYDGDWNALGCIDLEAGTASLPVMGTKMSDAQFTAVQHSWSKFGPNGWLAYDMYGIYPSGSPYSLNKPNAASDYPTVIGPTITSGPDFGATHTYQCFAVHENKVLVNGTHLYDTAAGTAKVVPGLGGANTGGCQNADQTMSIQTFCAPGGAAYYSLTSFDLTQDPPAFVTMDMHYEYVGGQGANVNFDAYTYCCIIRSDLWIVKCSSDHSPSFVPPLVWKIKLPLVAGSRNNISVIDTKTLINRWTVADMGDISTAYYGAPSFPRLQANTQAFNPDTNTMFIPAKDWSFYLWWKPLSSEMGRIDMQNVGPRQQTNSAYGRFQFYRKRGVFAIANEWDQPPYFFHL